MTSSALREALLTVELMIFDFDGPLCDVFAGDPAHIIATRMRNLLPESPEVDDPIEILRMAYETANGETAQIAEDLLIAAEVSAVSKSVSNSAGVESLRLAADLGISVGIVSNNSPQAVEEFLLQQSIKELVDVTVGRPLRHPELMKPDPHTLNAALKALDVPSCRSTLIGDSLTDIEAASRAQMSCIAFANKTGKREAFSVAKPAAIVDDMAEVAQCLATRR